MRSHYRRAMESVSLPADALEKIRSREGRREDMPRQRLAGTPQWRLEKMPRWRLEGTPRWKMAGSAAALCLAAAALSAGAVSAYGYFFHELPGDVASSLEPVALCSASQDITMTVQYASVEEGTLAVYLTLEDISGQDRLAQGVDFHDSYRVNKPDSAEEVLYRYESLGYDAESGTYGFLVRITPSNGTGDPLYFRDQQYILSVGQLLLGQVKSRPVLTPDWGTLPAGPHTRSQEVYDWGYVDQYSRPVRRGDGTVEVLEPGSWVLDAGEGFAVTAAGFLDNGFHVQLRYPDSGSAHGDSPASALYAVVIPDGGSTHDFGELALAAGTGETIGNGLEYVNDGRFCSVGFRGEGNMWYTEFIYDISPEDLEGASLLGNFSSGGSLLDGEWEVAFSLGQGEGVEASGAAEAVEE